MTVREKMAARFNEINGRAQMYSLLPYPDDHTRLSLDAERRGAQEMLIAYEEAALEENSQHDIFMRDLVHYLCTGEVSQELQAYVAGYTPGFASYASDSDIPERSYRPATLGTATRRA